MRNQLVFLLRIFYISTIFLLALLPATVVSAAGEIPAWEASTIYTGGDLVTHQQFTYEAKWWTRGEEPGTTGQWGVWKIIESSSGVEDVEENNDSDVDQTGKCTDLMQWNNSTVYWNGDEVMYNQHRFEAKWWTRGEEPGTTGQWGVWRDAGACGNDDQSDSDADDSGGSDEASDSPDGDDTESNGGDTGNNQGSPNRFPTKVFAPYVDVMLYPTFSLSDAYQQTGQKYYTLAFITSGSNCEPAWGGIIPASDNFYLDEINAIRNNSGDVIVSFGGANGTELAICKEDIKALQAAYQAVIDRYQLNWVDFDIEGYAVAEKSSIDRRNQAIAGLQADNPNLKVAFCLPVLPQGLTDDGLYVLKNALTHGVRIDVVNIMAMDYGAWGAPDPEGNMGQYAIDAAQSTYSQMQAMGLNTKVGITPMIGQNDVADERFYLDDAEKLYTFAEGTSYVSLLSMWSATRDNGNCPGQLSATCSGVSQGDFSFITTFLPFTAAE